MGKYLNIFPPTHALAGARLGNRKSDLIATLASAEIGGLVDAASLPSDKTLIVVVDNGPYEAALIAENQEKIDMVARSQENGDSRPCRYFVMDRETAEEMVDKKPWA